MQTNSDPVKQIDSKIEHEKQVDEWFNKPPQQQ